MATSRYAHRVPAVVALAALVAMLPLADPAGPPPRLRPQPTCGAAATTACAMGTDCGSDRTASERPRSPDAPHPGTAPAARCPLGKALPCCGSCSSGGVALDTGPAFAQDPCLTVVGAVDARRLTANSRRPQPPVPPPWSSPDRDDGRA